MKPNRSARLTTPRNGGHVLHRGQPQQRDGGGDLLGHGRRPRCERVQHVLDRGRSEEHGSAEELGHRDQVELQRRHDPEPALTAPDRPEELRVALGGDRPEFALGGDELDRADVVGGEAVAAGEVPHPSSERVADDPDARGRAGQRCQSVRYGGVDHLAPAHAGLDPGDLRDRVDPDTLHALGGHEDRAVCRRARTVPGGLDRQWEPFVVRVADRGDHVGGTAGRDDHGGAMCDGGVEPGGLGSGGRVLSVEDRSGHPVGEPLVRA